MMSKTDRGNIAALARESLSLLTLGDSEWNIIRRHKPHHQQNSNQVTEHVEDNIEYAEELPKRRAKKHSLLNSLWSFHSAESFNWR